MAEIGKDIDKAASILSSGGLVAIPTETVYGLAARADQDAAILKVFAAKNRPAFDPLITHIADISSLPELAHTIPVQAKKLMQAFWPGPLTVILPKSNRISDLISSGLPNAAFRVPKHVLLHQLLVKINFPIVAPSANPFGYVSPTSAQHVNEQLGNKIDYILDGGPCRIGLESTIISFADGQPTVLRLGGLPVEEIEKIIGSVTVNNLSTSKPVAPGMLTSHYAPSKPLLLGPIDKLLESNIGKMIGILSFSKKYVDYPNFVLSEGEDLNEAAVNLFTALRWFEKQNVEVIIAEKVPDKNIGRAINDRLKRASA